MTMLPQLEEAIYQWATTAGISAAEVESELSRREARRWVTPGVGEISPGRRYLLRE